MSEIKQVKEMNKIIKREEEISSQEKELMRQLKKLRDEKLILQNQKEGVTIDAKPRKQEPIRIKQITKWKKKYIIAEREGKILDEVKKDDNKKVIDYKINYQKNNSLNFGVSKVKLTNVTEYIDSNINLDNVKKGERFQYAYTINYKGKNITARSTQFKNSEINKKFANEHALNNLKRQLSYLSNGVSDADIGEKLIKDKNLKIKKSVIYYRKN